MGVRQRRRGIMLPKPEGYNFVVWTLVVSAAFLAFSRNRALSRVVLFFALAVFVGAVIWWVVSFL
jgi:hypothetical protein